MAPFSTEDALWRWLSPWSGRGTIMGVFLCVVLVGVASGRRRLSRSASCGSGRRLSDLSPDILKTFLQEPDLLLHLKLLFRICLFCQDSFYPSGCSDHTFNCVVPQFSYLHSQRSLQYT